MTEKKYCYRYVDGNASDGRPIVMLRERVIIRETAKTFWHCYDYPHMTTEQLKQMESRSKNGIKRCLKGSARSSYHLTKEEALRAFVYRKRYQLERMALTMETAKLCLDGLQEGGYITQGWRPETVRPPEGSVYVAAEELGPVAASFSWGEW
ncbi:hypothetical protein KWG64_07295 [Rahnella sp. PD12R]|uniref:hypothetical protein n=1 Tax=Rahnella sp. PD12R TaxID=2855688 RepID=UPI001C4638E6|nr:hypothetical protein [Rahnella sp. PD12R]MBV6817747.1 hypothetical protein [Rahnella sp. PD12R]